MAQIERIYRRAGIELSRRGARWPRPPGGPEMQRRSSPKHRYSAEQFGLTDDQIRAEFADYTARFIPEERA